MEEASNGGAKDVTAVAFFVVGVAAPGGSAQGEGDEPDATTPPPPTCEAAVVISGTAEGHQGGRDSLSAGQANELFNLLSPDSEPFIEWDPPPPQVTSSGGDSPLRVEEGGELVVLLGWLGASKKHLRRYADLYRNRGIGSLRFVVPARELVGNLGRGVERRVADLSAVIASWCDADPRRTLLFHMFSNTGWLTYGAVLENLQSRADIIERIKGCIIDSAPVLAIKPEVWAAGFSAAMLKKSSYFTGPSVGCSVSKSTRPSSWGETFLLSTLHKFFEIVLHIPDVNQRLRKVHTVLSEKQPSCPQLYLYSTADRVIPTECVESFISTQRSLGLNVFVHNFVSSPHVDHYRSFPHLYTAKVDEFLKICSPVAVETVRLERVGSATLRGTGAMGE